MCIPRCIYATSGVSLLSHSFFHKLPLDPSARTAATTAAALLLKTISGPDSISNTPATPRPALHRLTYPYQRLWGVTIDDGELEDLNNANYGDCEQKPKS